MIDKNFQFVDKYLDFEKSYVYFNYIYNRDIPNRNLIQIECPCGKYIPFINLIKGPKCCKKQNELFLNYNKQKFMII